MNEHLEAIKALAACYKIGGCGVRKDESESFRWYLMAAEAGDHRAQNLVSICDSLGIGAGEDVFKRIYWFDLIYSNTRKEPPIKFDISLPLIHRAVEHGQVKQVRELIGKSMANINLKDRYGRTPLHCASDVEIVRLLVECGAETSVKDIS